MSGSRKGIPNKNKQALIKLLELKYPDYNPILEMAAIATDKEADLRVRYDAHKEIAQYIYPKRKAIEVEHSGEITQKVVNAKPLSEDEWTERYGDSLESAEGTATRLN